MFWWFWLKRCPRCYQGDLYQSEDIYGRYVACLQCGYYLTQAEEAALKGLSRRRPMARTQKEATAEPAMAGGRSMLPITRQIRESKAA